MKTIPLKHAHELIENAAAVIVNHDALHCNAALMYPAVDELTGESDNEFLGLFWSDGDAYDFKVKAREGENQTVKVTDQGDLILVDDEGEEFEVTLLKMNVV